MKRLLVVGLVFGIVATSGVAWFARTELAAERAERTKDDMVLSEIVRRRTNSPAVRPETHNSPMQPARWDAPPLFAEAREIRSSDEPLFAEATPVQDRFAQAVRDVAPPQPQAFNPPRSRFAAPSFDQQPSAPDPSAFEASNQPPQFPNDSYSIEETTQSTPRALDSVNLTDGMAYAIFVHRAATHAQVNTMSRMVAGEPKSVMEPTARHDRAELRIYAESIETSSSNDFEFECTGKFVIVTDNSIMRGEGLKYTAGKFEVTAPEIQTPDATIKSSDASFAYDVSGISISTIRVEAEAEVSDEPNHDQWPVFDGSPMTQVLDLRPQSPQE